MVCKKKVIDILGAEFIKYGFVFEKQSQTTDPMLKFKQRFKQRFKINW